jgi:succinylarginine dihydrolase
VLTDEQIARMRSGVLLTEKLYDDLVACVNRHYRDAIRPEDLADPALAREANEALDELEMIIGMSVSRDTGF